MHHLKETNRWARCNVQVTSEKVLALAILNSQLSTAELSKACGSACLKFTTCTWCTSDTAASIDAKWPCLMIDYCNFMLNTLEEKPSLLGNILWTGDSMFTRAETVTVHSIHYTSLVKLHKPRTVWHHIQICSATCA